MDAQEAVGSLYFGAAIVDSYQFRTPPRSSSPRCSLALVTNSSHSSLRVFRDLHTLSFFGSQLSRILSAVCTLLPKKPGVHLYPEQTRRVVPAVALAEEGPPS